MQSSVSTLVNISEKYSDNESDNSRIIIIKSVEESFKNSFLAKSLNKNEYMIEVFIIESEEMKSLNYQYNQKDRDTNVISLQNYNYDELLSNKLPSIDLGSIFISKDTLKKEAKEYNIEVNEHIARLSIHGFLHIIGFDHQIEDEANKMRDMENIILEKLGFNVEGLTNNYWN